MSQACRRLHILTQKSVQNVAGESSEPFPSVLPTDYFYVMENFLTGGIRTNLPKLFLIIPNTSYYFPIGRNQVTYLVIDVRGVAITQRPE